MSPANELAVTFNNTSVPTAAVFALLGMMAVGVNGVVTFVVLPAYLTA
jgi:hypothetical protein